MEDYEALEPLIVQTVGDSDKSTYKILNLGCGNSVLSEEMYDKGFKAIYNVDISPVAIEQMAKRNSAKRPELKCKLKSY